MAQLREIVIDSMNPAKLAVFWANALTSYKVRPYSDAEIARLAAIGLTPETDPAVAVDGDGPTLFFQKSVDLKTQRNRIHFDICGGVREKEVGRLQTLGATVRDVHDNFTVMLDPEGNEFCVVDPRQE